MLETGQGSGETESIQFVVTFGEIDDKDSFELIEDASADDYPSSCGRGGQAYSESVILRIG